VTRDTKNIETEINDILAEWLPLGVKLSAQANLVSDPGFDSPRIVDVVLDVESRLNITIPVDQIVEIETVADLCRVVEGLVEQFK